MPLNTLKRRFLGQNDIRLYKMVRFPSLVQKSPYTLRIRAFLYCLNDYLS
jgi:hypothetical protein